MCGSPGEKEQEAGEERAGSGIPKVGEPREIEKISQHFVINILQ